jgi:hypothetical protein
MSASFKEIKSYGLRIWVCVLNGIVIAKSMSLQGCKFKVLQIIRDDKKIKENNENINIS